ncbi:hypothetical protein, partial [Streptomyces ipomoeae]
TVHPLAEAAEAARLVQTNRHTGKVGVLCLAPRPGLGVTDQAMRDRVGEDRLNLLRDTEAPSEPVPAPVTPGPEAAVAVPAR